MAKGPHSEREQAVVYAVAAVYQSPAGPEDHYKQAYESWEDLPAWRDLVDKCEGPWEVWGVILHSLR